MSAEVAAEAREMLRQVVTRGTASFINLATYHVAGKTGTADKPRPTGGYYDDKVIATFAGFFPSEDPQYVLVVTLDEPVETSGPSRAAPPAGPPCRSRPRWCAGSRRCWACARLNARRRPRLYARRNECGVKAPGTDAWQADRTAR